MEIDWISSWVNSKEIDILNIGRSILISGKDKHLLGNQIYQLR